MSDRGKVRGLDQVGGEGLEVFSLRFRVRSEEDERVDKEVPWGGEGSPVKVDLHLLSIQRLGIHSGGEGLDVTEGQPRESRGWTGG